jgi:hypothetical protein
MVAKYSLAVSPDLMESMGQSLEFVGSMGHAGRRGLRPGKHVLPPELIGDKSSFLRGGSTMPTIALRMAGFADCIDSTDMMLEWLAEMVRTKALPPLLLKEAAEVVAKAPSARL